MNDLGQAVLAIATGIIVIAAIGVVVGQKSQAPQIVQATASGLGSVIAAAVNPVGNSANNGNLGANAFSNPGSSVSSSAGFAGLTSLSSSLLSGSLIS